MKDTYFEKLKVKIFEVVDTANICAEKKDIKRNCVNYGKYIAYLEMLIGMGHDTDLVVYEDENGCFRIPVVKVDEKEWVRWE